MAGCKAVLHSQAFLAEPITRNTKADDEGHFSFTGLPSGPYIISVDAPPGFVSSRFKPSAQIVQLKSGEISPKLEFRFARESGIAGSVLTEAEHPVAGANVTVLAERYDAVTGVTGIVAKGNTTTAADGSYRVTGLAPGRYRVYVEPAGATEGSLVDTYWPSALEYDQGQIVAAMPSQQVSNLTIKVRAGETSIVRGRWVRSAESIGQEAVHARLVPLSAGEVDLFALSRTAPVAPDGAFQMDGVPAGRYRLEVESNQGLLASRDLILPDSAAGEGYLLHDAPKAALRGKVIAEHDVAGIDLSLRMIGAGGSEATTIRVPIDKGGDFQLESVCSCLYRVVLTSPGKLFISGLSVAGRDVSGTTVDLRQSAGNPLLITVSEGGGTALIRLKQQETGASAVSRK
jgi:hypothetical protein